MPKYDKSESNQKKYKKKGKGKMALSKRISKLERKTNRAELKRVDTSVDEVAIDFDGMMFNLNDIAQNLSDSGRVGNNVFLKNLTLRWYTELNGANSTILRVMVLWDKLFTVSIPGDFMQDAGNVLAVVSPKIFTRRFDTNIIYDKSWAIVNNSTELFRGSAVIPLRKFTQYGGATETSFETNRLLLYIVSTQPNVTAPVFTMTARVSFQDS